MKLFKDGDYKGLVDLYTPDCRMMPDNVGILEGKYSKY